MTPRTPRRTAAAGALALSVALATAACGTTDPAAAVLLDSGDVPVSLVEDQVSARLAVPGPAADAEARAELQQQVITQLVRSRLLERVAAEEGVRVSEGDVEAALRRLAGGAATTEAAYELAAEAGLDRDSARRLGRDEALRSALAARLAGGTQVPEEALRAAYEAAAAEFDTVSVRVLPVADTATAEATAAELQADPSRFEALAAERAADPANVQADPVEIGRGTSPPELEAQLFGTPVGSATVVEQGGSVFVVLVTDRTTVPFEEARETLRERVLGPQGEQALSERLAAEAEEADLRVNPRFGTWDPAALEVVLAEPTTSRPADDPAAPEAPLLPGAPGAPGGPGGPVPGEAPGGAVEPGPPPTS